MLNVKKTMLRHIFDIIAPHYCYGCGKVGAVVCNGCNYDIDSERSRVCIRCRQLLPSSRCQNCPYEFDGVYMVGPRTTVLKRLVDAAKFDSVREAVDVQADLLTRTLPDLSPVVVVPIPTIYPHIRRRGYDHTALLARRMAQRIDAASVSVLARRDTAVQHNATRKQRFLQASQAFRVAVPIEDTVNYLLVDDVTTTGATLLAAAKALREAGALHVYAAVTTYQPSD